MSRAAAKAARNAPHLFFREPSENDPADRELTHYLYGGEEAYRLKQEIILGIGGVRMLHALSFRVRQYHMNEGHAALLGLELLSLHAYESQDVRDGEARYDIPRVREKCNFTTHTPVEAGHEPLVERVLGDFIDLATLKRLAGQDALNMTRLAAITGVSLGLTLVLVELARPWGPTRALFGLRRS